MDSQRNTRQFLSLGNKIVVNSEFIGLGHTLQNKKRERKMIQHEQRQLTNKVMKIEQSENKAIKDYEKRLEQLQNIYKIRLRKQQQLENKEKAKKQKEQQIKFLKSQWRQERQRNAANKRASIQQILNKNKRAYFSEKKYKNNELSSRHSSLKKTIQQNIIKTSEGRHNKQSGLHKIIQYKRSKNLEYLNNYKSKLQSQQLKKEKYLLSIKQLNQTHKITQQKYLKNIQAKNRIQSIISEAHKLDLKDLQNIVMNQKPFKKSISTRRSLSRSESQKSIRNKQSSFSILNLNTERIDTRNPESQVDYSKINISKTIQTIQELQKLRDQKQKKQYIRRFSKKQIV